jgi:glycosyltransferase involved in cell wall biosynthesis
MRVLHVITGLGPGGAEHQLRLLLRHTPPGSECEVATLSNAGTVADAIRAGGTPVHDLGMRGNRDLAALPRLVRLIRRGRFDLVHTHLYRACLYGRIAAATAGVPAVATEHSLGDGLIEGRPTTAAVRALYLFGEWLGGATIAVSGTVAQRLVAWGVPGHRVRVVPNGIDLAELRFDPELRRATRSELGIPAGAPVVGAVGRLVPTKRFDLLVRALSGLDGVRLLLAGDGPERPALQRLAEQLGVAERVVFAGALPHARNALCAMDIFAFPSEQETFGLAVLEALACGLPVLYASCPPLAEMAPEAAPAALRVRPDEAALRDALRAGLGTRGDWRTRRPVPDLLARYDIATTARGVWQAYHDMLGRRRRPVATRLVWSDV